MKTGDWVQVQGPYEGTPTVYISQDNGYTTFRYKALKWDSETQAYTDILWVLNAVPEHEVSFLREADEESLQISSLSTPYGKD